MLANFQPNFGGSKFHQIDPNFFLLGLVYIIEWENDLPEKDFHKKVSLNNPSEGWTGDQSGNSYGKVHPILLKEHVHTYWCITGINPYEAKHHLMIFVTVKVVDQG